MRNLLIPVTIAASLSMTPLAFAAQTVNGSIKALDMSAHTVTLDNGTVYYLPDNFKDPGLKVGEKVKISWNMQDGKHEASDLTIVK